MPLTVIERHIENSFERKVFNAIRTRTEDGYLMHGVWLSGRNGLDVDILLMLLTGAFVIEVKDRGWRWLEVGMNGVDYYAKWAPVGGDPSPTKLPLHAKETMLGLAERKAKVLKSELRNLQGMQHYSVDTILVVPDNTVLVERNLPERVKACRLSDLEGWITQSSKSSTAQCCAKAELDAAVQQIGTPPDLQPGSEVRGYRLRSIRGGYREPGCPVEVESWNAISLEENLPVELRVYKILSSGGACDDSVGRAKRRLDRQKKALIENRDPQIPNLIDRFELRPYGQFLVFLQPDGVSLRNLVSDSGKLDHRSVLRLAKNIAEAVARLHGKDVVHLDLRPENVLLDKGQLKSGKIQFLCLTGFTNPRMRGSRVFTQTEYLDDFDASFVAPALRRPDSGARVGEECDIYSLGALMAYCAMGERDYISHVQYDQTIVPRSGCEPIDRIVALALKPPGARPYATMRDFLKALSVIRLP